MLSILLALGSSIAYGSADFLGGLAARKSPALRIVLISAPASLVVELVLLPFLGAAWTPASVGWGIASGFASAAAFVLLYASLAKGPMSVLSPITAVVSAVIPVGVGLLVGEQVSGWGATGIVLAILAVPLVAGGPTATRPTRSALLLALGAGTAIALQLVFLNASPADSGVAPLVVGRAVASLVVLVIVGMRRASLRGTARPPVALAITAGILDSLANLAFLLSSRSGLLAVVAVIVALYPAVTIGLATGLLHEKLHWFQIAGLALALTAVMLLVANS